MGAFLNRYLRLWVLTSTLPAALLLAGCEQEMALLKAFRPWNYSDNPATYYLGKPIKANVPSLKGESYSISPTLSAGLSFDTVTGIISGTPSALRPATNYSVTLSNSAGKSNVIVSIFVTEDEAPVITSFTTPATYASLTVPINSFTATDNIGVTGYCIVESNNSAGCNWATSAQASHTFTDSISPGAVVSKVLYAFARDAAGNISIPASSNISILGAINGICGPAHASIVLAAPTTGFCSAGSQTSVSGSGPWSWSCVGSNSGSSINCQAELKGACGSANGASSASAPSSTNLCSLGSASAISGGALSNSPWSWSCTGSAGAPSTVNCQAPVQGVCGSANALFTNSKPASNLCNSGAASAISGAGPLSDPWKWSCSGSTGGGTPANCSTHFIPVAGACGAANGAATPIAPTLNLCNAGTATAVTGSSPWVWSCVGSDGGATASCAAALPVVNGACGSSNGATLNAAPSTNLCNVGAASSVSPTSPWTWSCSGSGGGTNASCSAHLPVVNGVCGSANGTSGPSAPTSGFCSTGLATPVTGSGPWNWSCNGTGGGSNIGCSATFACLTPQVFNTVIKPNMLELNIPEVMSGPLNLCISPTVISEFPAVVTTTNTIEVLFVVDTTGSMSGAIYQVKSNLAAISAKLKLLAPTVRMGVAYFRDEGDIEIYKLVTPLSDDLSVVSAGLSTLSAGGGGDAPEAMFEAVYQGATGAGLSGSNPSIAASNPGWSTGTTVSKTIVVVSDAPGHIVPGGGHTSQQALDALNAAGIKFVGFDASGGSDQKFFANGTGSLTKAPILGLPANAPMVFPMDGSGNIIGAPSLDALAIALSGAIAQSISYILHFTLAGDTYRLTSPQTADVYMTPLTTVEGCSPITIVPKANPSCNAFQTINITLGETTLPKALDAGKYVTVKP